MALNFFQQSAMQNTGINRGIPVYFIIKDDEISELEVASFEDAVDMAQVECAEIFIFSVFAEEPIPTEKMMRAQQMLNIPFGIFSVNNGIASQILFWGDSCPIVPVLGRPFIHGIYDCYSLVRDVFRLGKVELEKQGIKNWPYNSIKLPDVPRSDNWWNNDMNLYMDWMKPAGFVKIEKESVRPGDGFLLSIKSKTPNHAGLVLENNQIIHHLPTRLSRRENAGMWNYQAEIWVRYNGN